MQSSLGTPSRVSRLARLLAPARSKWHATWRFALDLGLPPFDIVGHARSYNGSVDMGAYERGDAIFAECRFRSGAAGLSAEIEGTSRRNGIPAPGRPTARLGRAA